MRILVADQNALLLAAIAATFGRHCEIVTATRRDVCMAHVEQHHFDVVVACEKLVGYTGLELLSELEAVSPTTLRIFAARPEALKRLDKRLDFFGLLGTLHYPIEARKLLVALKVARSKLPGHPKPPKVKHVVLESEWDTGERLALLGQELEDAPAVKHDETAAHAATECAIAELTTAHSETPLPESPASEEPATEYWAVPGSAVETSALVQARHLAEASSFEVSFEVSFDENPSRFDVTGHGATHASVAAEMGGDATAAADEAPPYLDVGAANDEAFSDAPAQKATAHAPSQAAPKPTASKPAATTPPGRPSSAKGPRPRKATVPTAAQREAFQRALARRNAARAAGWVDAPPIDFSSMTTMSATRPVQTSGGRPPAGSSQSPAASSQSLADLARMATTKRPLGASRRGPRPKRRVFVVGSGIAAALLVAVVCFELLRADPSHEHGRHARAASVRLFSQASTLVADNSGNPPQVFSPPPPQPAATEPVAGTASALPQAQTFDPDTAPPDPPPPPALEHPGPMEPPSMGHHGRPPGLQENSADE